MSDVVDGRYRIIETVGEGGMGTVYRAYDVRSGRRVALKILRAELATDPKVLARFMNEARAAGKLGHPHIVESMDMGVTADRVPYIVFEYLEGTLLASEIDRVGGFPAARAVRIGAQIASALQAAHDAGIVHRDLKSDNVFLIGADFVKVLDFGVSRFQGEKSGSGHGFAIGTPSCMAPEQVVAPDTVDHRADIYALGVVLYEMLAARRPFAMADSSLDAVHALLTRVVNEPPPPLDRPDAPPWLVELVVDKLLAKDRDRRFQTMREVEAALAGVEI